MSDLIFVDKAIDMELVKKVAKQRFGDMVKVVIDIDKKLMVIGGELHADEEAWLLDQGSIQDNLWGINIYPDLTMPDALEFDSMINVRPSKGNPSREVQDEVIKNQIIRIVQTLIPDLK